MRHSISIPIHFCSILLLGLLTGCVPYPHATPRSSEVWGRVLDANTRAPIQGAAVFLVQSPNHTTYTDKKGYFHLRATRNVILGIAGAGGEWPDEKSSIMEISHTNYMAVAGTWEGDVGDILLKPK